MEVHQGQWLAWSHLVNKGQSQNYKQEEKKPCLETQI